MENSKELRPSFSGEKVHSRNNSKHPKYNLTIQTKKDGGAKLGRFLPRGPGPGPE
jgi:hypothetical protein